MVKLKFKHNKRINNFSIRLYDNDRDYKLTWFYKKWFCFRLEINYNTNELILKHGYNCKHLGY